MRHPNYNIGPKDRNAKELVGHVAYIKWSDPDTGFVIALLKTGEVVKGSSGEDELEIGLSYRFLGRWEENPKFGPQFAFSTYIPHFAHDRAGVVKYLSDLCDGIGKATADKLWEKYGSEAVEVLRTTPLRVFEDRLLSMEVANEAAKVLKANAALEHTKIDLFALIAGRGFPGDKFIKKAIATWGAKAAKVLHRNPFAALTHEIPGAGFKRCDRMWLDFGLPLDRLKRQMLCGWNHLRSDGTGHTWFRAESVGRIITEAIGGGPRVNPVKALRLGIRARWLDKIKVEGGFTWVAEAEKARNERMVADRIAALLRTTKQLWPCADMLAGLTAHQREKIGLSFGGAIGILAGTPGTGKTFTTASAIRDIIDIFGQHSVAICAPTGKAAVRCSEAMRRNGVRAHATTIHSLLEITRNGHDGQGWAFKFNWLNPLPFNFVIVDEVSMLDTDLAAALLSACRDGTHVLLVGDPYQLPPVGHGAPLRDMIAAGVPCGELSEIQRNAGQIVVACASIKAGDQVETCERFDEPAGMNLRHFKVDDPADARESLVKVFDSIKANNPGKPRAEQFDPLWDVQVIVGLNEKSELSRVELNKLLQGHLNPDGKRFDGNPFRVQDKVICTKNCLMGLYYHQTNTQADDPDNYRPVHDWDKATEAFLANGEIGHVLAVGPKVAVAKFDGNRIVRIAIGKGKNAELGDLEGEPSGGDGSGRAGDFSLAYAITVHKSQGSEWPLVIALIDKQASRVASREFWYTAISRAKRRCILIGPEFVFEKQCRKVSLEKRKTFLAELIAEARNRPVEAEEEVADASAD